MVRFWIYFQSIVKRICCQRRFGLKRRFRLKAKVTRIATYRMEKIVKQQTGSGKDT